MIFLLFPLFSGGLDGDWRQVSISVKIWTSVRIKITDYMTVWASSASARFLRQRWSGWRSSVSPLSRSFLHNFSLSENRISWLCDDVRHLFRNYVSSSSSVSDRVVVPGLSGSAPIMTSMSWLKTIWEIGKRIERFWCTHARYLSCPTKYRWTYSWRWSCLRQFFDVGRVFWMDWTNDLSWLSCVKFLIKITILWKLVVFYKPFVMSTSLCISINTKFRVGGDVDTCRVNVVRFSENQKESPPRFLQ